MFQYRELVLDELNRELFRAFIRRQDVTKCWRKENGRWIIRDAPFIDDWGEEEYQILVKCLKNTIATGGFVYADVKARSYPVSYKQGYQTFHWYPCFIYIFYLLNMLSRLCFFCCDFCGDCCGLTFTSFCPFLFVVTSAINL